MSRQTLLNRLQPFMRKSKIYSQVFDADAKEIQKRNEQIDDLKKQFSVDTATWGLAFFERDYGIPIDESKSIEDRRALVKSKMRGSGTVTSGLIKDVALAFTGGQVDVNFNGKIIITFTDIVGIPPNMDDFKAAINEIKPAHLDIIYAYLFNQYQDLIGYTYGQLEQYTHEQLRSSEIG